MTNANMKLVFVGVSFPGELEAPKQKLEPGESIVRRVVELSKLADEMKGSFSCIPILLRGLNTNFLKHSVQ